MLLDHCKEERVTGVGQSAATAKGLGSIMLTDYQGYKCILTNVLYVPSAETSIISFTKARKQDLKLKFSANDDFKLSYMKTLLHLSGQIIDNIFYVQEEKQPIKSYTVSTRAIEKRK